VKNSLGCVIHDTGNKTVTCITCISYKIKTEHNNFWKEPSYHHHQHCRHIRTL